MKRLKILINYSPACRDDKTGIPVVVENLYNELKIIDNVNIYKTLCLEKLIPLKIFKINKFINKYIYRYILLPFQLKFGKYDVYIESEYIFKPLFKPKNIIVSNIVYDIALLLYDNLQTKEFVSNWKKNFLNTLSYTDLILTISKNSRNDIKKYLKKLNKKIPVEYFYLDAQITIKNNNIEVSKIIDLNSSYILFIGTLEPRKNPLNILKGFHLYKLKTKSKTKLIFAGKKGWLYSDVIEYIENNKLNNEVIFTGYISEIEKAILLKNAKAFIFLSQYEGFGIPALEALKMGVPVLLSDIPVFHELFGDNAYYTKINDEDIANSIERILNKPCKINQKEINRYSWKESAETIVKILFKYKREK